MTVTLTAAALAGCLRDNGITERAARPLSFRHVKRKCGGRRRRCRVNFPGSEVGGRSLRGRETHTPLSAATTLAGKD